MRIRKRAIGLMMLAGMIGSGLTACDKPSEENREVYVRPDEMKGEISVSVYQSSEWLQMAVEMFEKKYPDMKVEIQAFYTGIDTLTTESGAEIMNERPAGQTKEDYATWLNTRLLSGDAADIVITSEGLAVEKYENMGVFEDLTPYLAATEEIDEEGYYMNIFDAYRTESGELYQFPTSAMACPIFCFNREIVEETGLLPDVESMTWREALDVAEEMYDASSLSGRAFPGDRSFLAPFLIQAIVGSVDYGNGTLDLREEELLDILNAFEEFGYYNSYSYGGDFFEVFKLPYTPDVECAEYVTSGEVVALQCRQIDGKVHLSPYFSMDFGINSQSEHKPLAWEFLKFLVSDEVQTLPAFPNAGVNKNGLRARVETYCKGYEMPDEEAEERIRVIDGWLAQVNGYRQEDTDLIQLEESVLADFLNGDLTAEEAVEEIRLRLEQYLSE